MAPDVVSSLPSVPVTQERQPPQGLEKDITQPGELSERCRQAISRQGPSGRGVPPATPQPRALMRARVAFSRTT